MIRPFPKPQLFSKWFSGRKVVTIAAGFVCKDGIVLCADSQETVNDYLKVSVPKVEIRPAGRIASRKGLFAVFVGAGHAALIDKLIDEMWEAAERLRGGFRETVAAMKKANRDYYKELKEVFRDRDPEYPRVEIIFAVSLKREVALFKATGPVINRVRNYEVAGIGDILARYICDRGARIHEMTVSRAIIISLYILNQTESYVEGCGGQGQIVIVRRGQQPECMDGMKQTAAASQLPFLDIQAVQTLLFTPDLEISDDEFESRLRRLVQGLRHSRLQQRQFRQMILDSIEKQKRELSALEDGPKPSTSQKSEQGQ